MRVADQGITDLQACVDTLIVIPNQNLFRIANEKTTFADAFAMADQVLFSGVACITDLMVKEGLINLDFADVRSVMREMGKAMMGTGEASGERRAIQAAEAAIANPLLDETSMKGAGGLLISITGGRDLTLFEVDEAATRIREEVDPDANIILGATFEESLEGVIRVSVVATGIDSEAAAEMGAIERTSEIARPKPAPAVKPAVAPRPAPAVSRPVTPTPPMKPAAEAPAAAAAYQQGYGQSSYNMDGHLTATVAMATQPHPVAQAQQRHADITITQVEPAGARYAAEEIDADHAPMPDADTHHHHAEAPFIPPPVEAPPSRMPKVEDFPPVAQRQFEAHREAPSTEEDRGPLSLLRRLANVGLGRREDDPIGAGPQQRGPAAQPQAQRSAATQPRPQQARPVAPAAQGGDYAKRPPTPRAPAQEGLYRPRQGDLDAHGRPLPGAARSGDDELEIPAFLRRQAN